MPTFLTTRGDWNNSSPVSYDLIAEFSETNRADGLIEQTVVAQVPWSQAAHFIASILPDVRLGSGNNKYVLDGALASPGIPALPSYPAHVHLTPINETRAIVTRPRLRLERLLPQTHPLKAGLFAMEAKIVRGMGYPDFDEQSAWITFLQQRTELIGNAQIAVTFRTLPFNAVVSDAITNVANQSELRRFVSRDIKGGGENLPVKYTSVFVFIPSGGGAANVVPADAIQVPFAKDYLTYTWHMVPAIPSTALTLRGYINADGVSVADSGLPLVGGTHRTTVFDWDYDRAADGVPRARHVIRNYAWPGTLLYLSYETSKTYTTLSGNFVRDITYQFVLREPGHNYLLNPLRNAFERIAPTSVPTELVPGFVAGAVIPANILREVVRFPDGSDQIGDAVGPGAFAYPYQFVLLEDLFKIDESTVRPIRRV